MNFKWEIMSHFPGLIKSLKISDEIWKPDWASQCTFHLSAEWHAIIRKSSTMEEVSAVFKAKSSTLFFIYFLDSTHSDLLETYLPRFVPAAH